MGGISCLGFLLLSALFLFPDILDDQNQIIGASFVVMASALMALWLTKTRRLWPDSLAGVLSRRMKERDAFSGAITWLLCGAIVGIPLMLVTTAVTTENTMNLTQIDSVPPNTVRVTMADRLGKPMEIPEPLQAQVDAEFPQQPIRIRRVAEEQSVLPQTTVQVGFDAFRMGQLWVFESVSDIDQWLGGLSPEQKATLNNGGILGTDARDGVIPVHVSSLDGTTRTETVTATPVELPREYLVGMTFEQSRFDPSPKPATYRWVRHLWSTRISTKPPKHVRHSNNHNFPYWASPLMYTTNSTTFPFPPT